MTEGDPGRGDPPALVLTEAHSAITGRLWAFAGFAALGALLLAVPGPYLREWRVFGALCLLLALTGSSPFVQRLRHGPHRLEIRQDAFWFTSRFGDGTVRWQDCGRFHLVHRTRGGEWKPPRGGWTANLAVAVEAYVDRARARERLKRRASGWDQVVLPSRYGLSAQTLVEILESCREDVLAGRPVITRVTSIPAPGIGGTS